jgi:hypothetical protein
MINKLCGCGFSKTARLNQSQCTSETAKLVKSSTKNTKYIACIQTRASLKNLERLSRSWSLKRHPSQQSTQEGGQAQLLRRHFRLKDLLSRRPRDLPLVAYTSLGMKIEQTSWNSSLDILSLMCAEVPHGLRLMFQ